MYNNCRKDYVLVLSTKEIWLFGIYCLQNLLSILVSLNIPTISSIHFGVSQYPDNQFLLTQLFNNKHLKYSNTNRLHYLQFKFYPTVPSSYKVNDYLLDLNICNSNSTIFGLLCKCSIYRTQYTNSFDIENQMIFSPLQFYL